MAPVSDAAKYTNRLIHETSPYLLQHAHNPVDWYPWGDEALARAKELDRPIFLSIGYAACHWCHVMERESFEDEAAAAELNTDFVSIKVDREERPDLDSIYMGALQALTGQGGWPMSMFLTPDGLSYAEAVQASAPDAGVVDAGAKGAADGGAADAGVVAQSAPKSERILASTAEPGAPLDLQFRAAGKACDTCHPDPHKVRESIDCGSCHGEATWKSPPKNGYHERAGFALTGAHTVVACSMCHSGAGSLAGRGERCGGCHQQDDVHAGSLRSDCGRCHDQSGWMPTTFNHVDTGYVLQGIHRTLDCRQCHQAGNYFIGGQRCANCHLRDYRESDWHNVDLIVNRGFNDDKFHVVGGQSNEPAGFECDYCHKNQWSWELGVIE